MYREKANPLETTEMPMVIPGRNDGAGKRRASRSAGIYRIYFPLTLIRTVIFELDKRNRRAMCGLPRSGVEGRGVIEGKMAEQLAIP